MSSRGDGRSRMLVTCYAQAHAPLPLPAGHTRMPPGLQQSCDRACVKGLLSPASRLSREAGSDCSLRASRQVECREDRKIVDEWRAEGVVSSRRYQIIVNLACARPERAALRKRRIMLWHVARPLADSGGNRLGRFRAARGRKQTFVHASGRVRSNALGGRQSVLY
jgi:hypothetical protein